MPRLNKRQRGMSPEQARGRVRLMGERSGEGKIFQEEMTP
ncbi:hypothetical protein C725_2355 [Pacificimonas flava]|uniref:Uncharacterized protein n=1 Tax=Pacificimonas flava TaxID=1234595 RepID=M2U2X2_9SPHN|nr:hypothetical protein C725_2355 [Pacificimonas flava]